MTLRADGLACRRGGRMVFEGLSLAVEPGECLTLEGANGSGKSSLLRILAGLLRAEAGTVDNPHRLAWLGHDDALKPERTPRGELRFWGGLDAVPAAATDAALARFALGPLADLPVRLLSAGQRRRVALARVWQSGAPLWLLDEPATALDSASLRQLSDACAEHCARGGLIVAATHQILGLDAARKLSLERYSVAPGGPRDAGVLAS